jgi:chromosome segregation ATPase
MDENESKVETTETTTTPEVQGETPEQLKARLTEAEKRIKELNRESAERRKKLEAFELAEAKRKEAEMTETEKLKAELERERGERLQTLREVVAARTGLPEALADRLRGATREELEADAAAILEKLPKTPEPAKTTPPTGLTITNPGAATTGETKEQRRARLGL